MSATQQATDRDAPADSVESLNTLTIDAEEKSVGDEKVKGQVPSTEDERIISPSLPQDAASRDPPREISHQLASLDVGGGHNAVYQPNIYAPQAQTIYYGGYENATGEWDEYPQYLNPEGVDIGSHGNPSLVFHSGYGYSPQVPYGPYSPVTTPLPSGRGDGQLYSTQQFPFMGPYFQQPVPHSMPYLNSPAPVSQADLTLPVGIGQQGAFLANTNSNGMLLEHRSSYPLSYGSFGRGSFAGNSGNPNFYDSRQGFDMFGSGGLWSDWLKSPDGQRSFAPLSSPVASRQSVGPTGTFGHSVTPFASTMASQQQRPSYGFQPSISSYDGGYSHGQMYHQGTNFAASSGINDRGWFAVDKGRRRGKANAVLCNCNGTLDFLSEQNRGPRATRPKNLVAEQDSSVNGKNDTPTAVVDHKLFNKPDFVTEYINAKFFIIKSYSEDNVHKSIKYGVWASTPNGNKKLDSAYHEAIEKGADCPVFLFFSVNASAQFCGVAEMIGPVDFEKSVDYWQQDKWSGQFPVKWHIIKDVPNSLFRHIILENNDNKPVTNSRDTQEVKLEQGLEMLDLFKKHESDVSILDDFNFYEEREKAMQERKAFQQQQSHSVVTFPVAAASEQQKPAPLSGDFVSQMSKSFAQGMRLDESGKEDPAATENVALAAAVVKAGELTKSSSTTMAQSS